MSHTDHLTKTDYFVAGSISGFIARVAVQPFDVIKIRFQLQVEPIRSPTVDTIGKYSGIIQSIRCIFKEEGFSAFWKGHIPAQAQAVSFTAVQFFTFEFLTEKYRRLLPHNGHHHDHDSDSTVKLSPMGNVAIGAIAGSCAAIVTQPLDILRTRFIAQGTGHHQVYNDLLHGCITIAKTEGFQGFFRGLSPTLLLIAPQIGLQFGFYNVFTTAIQNLHTDHALLTGFDTLISGAMAGILAKVAVYPLDMAKKRMQVQGFEKAREKFGKVHVSKGLLQCLQVTVKEEGVMALFKGLRPSLLKSCISVGARFSVYEEMCQVLGRYHTSSADEKRPTS